MKVFPVCVPIILCFCLLSNADVTPYTACPSEKCYTNLNEVFLKCAPHFFVGCTMIPIACPGGPGYVCSKKEAEDTEVEVEPGKPIELETVKLYTSYSFKVNLSALPLETDFYLLSDGTGSMKKAIANVKSQFGLLVDYFLEKSAKPYFGVGYYKDEKEVGMVNGFKNSQPLTDNIGNVKAAISSLPAQGGGDNDEANLVALYKVATDNSIKWRKDSRKILVYFGDWPGHEPTCFGGKTITRADVIGALRAKKITVIAVSFKPLGFEGLNNIPSKLSGCMAAGTAGKNQGTEIATATINGELIESTDQAKIISTIKEAIENIPRTFSVDTSDCAGKISSVTTPELPQTLSVGDSLTIDQKVTILFGACTSPEHKFSCDLKYSESGADLGAVKFTALNIDGC